MANFDILKKTLTEAQVIELGAEGYEGAINIGNLLYRMTIPAAVVRAKSVNDVQSTLAFARENRLRLTVKNGGHSYMGYCLNTGGIVLDLSLMDTCHVDHKRMLVTMDAGAIWRGVYEKYKEDPRNIIIGGQCPTVGVSGFTLGAGLSPFSRSYGLGCDNLLEMTIVTWDGKVVTVSKEDKDEEKRELFWALAGGGGGNFGVTVSLLSRMHKLRDDDGKVVCGTLLWNLPQQKDNFEKMMNVFNTTKWPVELTIDALWSHGKNKQLTGGMTVIFNGRMKEAKEVLQPLLDFEPSSDNLKEMMWIDWVHYSAGWDPKSKVYHHHASFIFAEGAITPGLTRKISDIVEEASRVVGITNENGQNDPKCHFLWDHIGGVTEKYGPEETAFYWRKGHYVSNIKMVWNREEKTNEIMDFVAKCKVELLPYAIDQKAAYINYIDGTVDKWEEAYYGHNYPRLQKVKTRWDPHNFFHYWRSIKPLKEGEKPLHIHDVVPVPTQKEARELPQVRQLEQWWNLYAPLVSPDQLGSPKTDEDVYKRDAQIRKEIASKVLQNGDGTY